MTVAKIRTPQPSAKPSRKVQALLAVGVLVQILNGIVTNATSLHLSGPIVGAVSVVAGAIAAYLATEQHSIELPDDEGETGAFTGAPT